MNTTEEKSLKAQLKLYKDIRMCELNIEDGVKRRATEIHGKLYDDYYQTTMDKTINDDITISMEDFKMVKDFLSIIDNGRYQNISDNCNFFHTERETKLEFLEMLK